MKKNGNTGNNKIKQYLAVIAAIIVIVALQFGISKYIYNMQEEAEVYFYEYRIAETEIVVSPETYTGEEVTVEITTQKPGLSIQYKLLGEDEWIDYTGPFAVYENTIVSARLVSKDDNFEGPITDKEIKNIAVAKIGDEYYKTLAAAIEACPENAGNTETKIEMLVSINESVVIPQGKNIILDLCGATIQGTNKISIESSEEGDVTEQTAEAAIKVEGKLNLIDSAKNEDGTLQGNGKVLSTITTAIKVAKTGDFTLGINESGENVSVSINNPEVIGETYGVVVEENGIFNFYDGKISGKTNAISGEVTKTAEGYDVIKNIDGEYEVAILSKLVTITFDKNPGETGDENDIIIEFASVLKPIGAKIENLPTAQREGYTFVGWYTAKENGEQVTLETTITEETTFYAIWDVYTYTIEYNSNNGTGDVQKVNVKYDEEISVANNSFTAPTGYTFKEWNTEADGNGEAHNVGDKVKNLTNQNSATVKLYAIWQDTIDPNKEAPTGTGTTNSITVNCNQTDDGTGIDTTTIEYAIFNKDTNSDGTSDAWSDWQTSQTFTNLKANTEYQVKTRVKDNAGNGPIESEIGKISTSKIQNGTLVIHKDNEQGDIVTPETSSDNKNNPINNNIYLAITPSTTGTTTVTVKTPDGTTTEYSQNTAVTTQTGMYEITLKTTDGTNEVKDIYYIYVDKTLPTINATSTATTNSITVNANAQDEHSIVTSVTYTIKNGEQVIETNTTGVFTGLEDNTNYTVEITVTDKPGNVATSAEIIKTEKLEVGTLTFEELSTLTAFAPVTTEPTDSANIVWINENVNIKLTQSTTGTTTYEVTAPDGTKTQYSADSQITTQDGAYIATVSTTDGINTEKANYYFSVDKTNPTVTINPNAQEYTIAVGNNMATIGTTLTATDNVNGSGVFTTKYAWSTSNTDEPQSWSDFTSGVEVTTSVNGGIYYVWTNVVDKAGNKTTVVKTSGEFNVGYAVEFDTNGGTDTIESQRKEHGIDLTLTNTIPTKDGFIFKGWASTQDATTPEYTVSAGSSSLYTTDASIKLYAVWSEVVASTTIDGVTTNYESVQGAIDAAGTNVATVTLLKETITESVTIAAGQNIELETNGKTLTSEGSTITNIGTLSIKGTGTIISTKNIAIINETVETLTINEATIQSNTSRGISNVSTGTIEILGGTVTGQSFGIYDTTAGTIKIKGGTVEAINGTAIRSYGTNMNISGEDTLIKGNYGIYEHSTANIKINGGKVQAISNHGIRFENGTLNISGDTTQIEGYTRGIATTKGNVIITSGTIIATNGMGIRIDGGTLTLGINEENPNVSYTSPTVKGSEYGITVASGIFNFYDGIVKGEEGKSISGTVADTPTGYRVVNGTEIMEETTYETAYLSNNYQIIFDDNCENGSTQTLDKAYNSKLGTLPTPTTTVLGYKFDGWYTGKTDGTKVTENTLVTGDTTYYAHWEASKDIPYTVYHYRENANDANYELVKTEYLYGEADSILTLGNLSKPGNDELANCTLVKTSLTEDGESATTTTIDVNGTTKVYIYYARNTFQLTVEAGQYVNSVGTSGTYKWGQTVNLTAEIESLAGYTYSNFAWSTTNQNVNIDDIVADKTQTQTTLIMPSEATTITATINRTAITYNLTYNLDGGQMADGKTNPLTYTVEDDVTLNPTEKEGYVFVGWQLVTLDGQNVDNSPVVNAIPAGSTGNRTYKAIYNNGDVIYTVYHYLENANDDGYTIYDTKAINAKTNDVITLDASVAIAMPNATYEKSTETLDGVQGTSITVAADSSSKIYVYYTRNTYTLKLVAGDNVNTVKINDNAISDMEDLAFKYGQTVNISAIVSSLDGYTYSNFRWETTDLSILASTTTKETTVTMPVANTTITAVADRTINTYNITYNLDGGNLPEGSQNPSTYTVETDDITLVNPSKTGYTFAGWTGTDLENADKNVTIPTGSIGDRSYTATWTIDEYTVTYDYGTNGGASKTDSSIKTEDVKVNYNTAIDLTKQGTKSNYTFIGWNTDATAITAIDSLTMGTENVTLYAIYSKEVTVKYDKNGGADDVLTTYTLYNKETSLEITTPNPTTFTGWTFKGYADTNTGTTGDLAGVTKTITVAENIIEITYYHTWAKTVTYDGNKPSIAESSYNVTLNEQTREIYYNNKFGTLPTNPTLQGFTFNGWYILAQDGTQITEDTLAQDVPNTIYANWTLSATMNATPEQVTLDLSDNKTQAITITGSNYGTVSYKSAHTNIATVDANGLITAIANGSTTITVTSSNGNLTDTVLVTVVTTPTSIEISQDSAVIGILANNTVALNATITPNTANTKNGVTWSSNNSDIAKVDSKTGVVTGVEKGTAIITATTENGCTDTCQITVDGTAPIVSVTMDSAEYEQAHTATVTITDDVGGLPASQSISYAWSKTKDTVPTDWQTKTVTTTEGNLTATTQIDAPYDSTGVYYIWIKSGVQDKFGNSTTGHYLNIQVTANLDNTSPVIALSGTASPLNASANSNIVIPIKITEEHSGMNTTGAITDCLTAEDIVVKVNGTTVTPTTKEIKYNTSANGVYSYTLNLAGVQGSGKLTVQIDAGKVKDMAGNLNDATSLETGVTMDASSFSATITTESVNPNNLSEITYKITFNKPVTGFTQEDIEVTNGTKGTFVQTDELGKEFTIVVTNSGSCYQTIDVTTGSCTDASGNQLSDVTKLTIQIDRTAPTAPEVTARASSTTGTVKGTVVAGEAATVYTGVANTVLTFAGTDNETQVVGYKVATSADADFASLETVNSFNVTAPTWGLTYYVKSVDEVGNISEDATEVTVRLVTLSITPETMSIENEKTGTLTPERANVGTITWTSSDNTIATVSAAGVVTAKKVGQVTITATSSNDTTVKDTSVITVTKGNVEVPTAVTGLVYNGTAQTGVVDNSDKYTITGNTQTNAGSYQAVAKLSDPINYQWADGTSTDKTINWQIAQKQLIVTVSAQDKVYDGTRNVNQGMITLAGIVTGDSVLAGATFQYETATVGTDKLINVTEFALAGEDADNYVLDITETTTTADITKATLTATYVSETIKYGQTPALKVNVTGFVNGETATTAAGYTAPKVTDRDTAIGEYTLTPAGGLATNYTFKYVSGKLTIEAINYTITYELNGGALPTGKTNPTTYTMISDTFTLNNPTKSGYEFLGWTGTGLTSNTETVIVAKGSTGNRTYTANWQLVAPTVSVTAENLNINLFNDVTTTFTANVENGANPTYQWYYNDAPIDGATQSTYSLPTSEMTESNYKGGAYKVAVTNNEEAQAVMLLADGNNTTTVSDTFTQTVAITVGNANQLKNLATRVNDQDIKFTGNTIKQTANIDLSSVCGSSKGSFTPIGYYDPTNGALSKAIHGTYDGQNFEVTNLYIDETTTFNRVALFGLIWDGTVKNLTVRGTVTTSDTATVTAGIVGQGTAATIENCKNYVNVSGPTYVAGILGFGHGTYVANIINCENYGTITVGVNYGGGIAGLGNAIIDNCRNYGSVNGTNVGGIASYNNESSDIRNCTNNGTVTGINVGGICFKGFANITHCTNNGEIIAKNTGSDGSLYAAGIAYMNLGIIEETKNTGKVTAIGESNNAGIVVAGILARDSSAATGTIRKSFNTGEIIAKCVYTGTSDAMAVAGGIVGYANDNLIIEDCYNTGNVTSTKKQGGNTNSASGIIGYCISANLEIKNCYSSGLITTQREDGKGSFNGGILAQKVVEEGQTVTITNCYYEQGKAAGGIQGTNVTGSAEPKTAAYMITDDFVTLLGASNWEIVATFNKHYPVLDWEYETSTITYDLAGGQLPTETTNPSKYAKESANYTLVNPTKPGYTFKGWTGSNGTTAQTSVTIASGSTGNKSYTANWEANTYYLAYYDGTILLDTVEYKYDETKNLTTMAALGGSKSGFTFQEWRTGLDNSIVFADGQAVSKLTSIPNNTVKIYAIWKRNVTFVSGPKATSTSASAVQYYNSRTENYSVLTPKPADISNWTALGWREDTTAGDKTIASESVSTSSASVFYGAYSRQVNCYSGENKETVVQATEYYNTGSAAHSTKLPTPATLTGWTIRGWRIDTTADDKEFAAGGTSTTASAVYYAVYARDITFYHGTAKAKTTTVQQYYNSATSDKGLITMPTANTISSWNTLGWRYDTTAAAAIYTESQSVAPVSQLVYYAVYSRSITMKYNANGGTGTIADSSKTQYYNTNGAITAMSFTLPSSGFTKSGGKLSKWAAGSASGTQYNLGATYTAFSPAVGTTTVTQTMYAIWANSTYTVNYYNGATLLGSSSHTYGTAKALTTIANLGGSLSGYTFYGWTASTTATARTYTNGQSVNNLTTTDGGTVNLYAIWSRTATFYSGTSSATTATATQYYNNKGAKYSVTTPSTGGTKSGWTLAGWRDDSTAAAQETAAGSASTSSSATFYAVYYRNITFYSGIAKATNTAVKQYYNSYNTTGSITTPSITAINNGFSILGWRNDTTLGASENAVGATIASPSTTYYAVYSRTITLKYNANGGSGTVANQTKTQYYNSYGNITSISFTLSANAFTNGDLNFSKWAAGSATGTQYAAGVSYAFSPAVSSSTITQTMYAIWSTQKVIEFTNGTSAGGGGGNQSGGGGGSQTKGTLGIGYTVYYKLSASSTTGGSGTASITYDSVEKDSISVSDGNSQVKEGSFTTTTSGILLFSGGGSGGTGASGTGGCTIVKILDSDGNECILQ